MQWLNKIVDEVIVRNPKGEITVESGISPSGVYHMGYLREIITCDAIKLELERRDRQVRHVHFVDDLDGFRKVPSNLSDDYKKYLGQPLCDMPAPDGSDISYADYCLKAAALLRMGPISSNDRAVAEEWEKQGKKKEDYRWPGDPEPVKRDRPAENRVGC